MEDNNSLNNPINNDTSTKDPLISLYNTYNDKYKFAKTVDDFKSALNDNDNRKKFFDKFNDEIKIAKDFNSFNKYFKTEKIKKESPLDTHKYDLDKSLFEVKGKTSEAVVGGPIETLKISEQKKDKREKESKAIDRQISIREKNYGQKLSSQQVNNYKSLYNDMLKSGNAVVTRDSKGEPMLAQANTSIFSSLLDTYNDLFKKSQDDIRFQGLSKLDRIKAHEADLYKEEDMPSVPTGYGKIGQTIAENIYPLVQPTIYATAAATAALTGAGDIEAAKQFGNAVGFIKDMMYGSYKENWDKVYSGNLKSIQKPTEQDKINAADKADNAALVSASIGGATGAAFSIPLGKIGNNITEASTNYIETLGNIAKHTGEEANKLFGITAISELAKG